MDEFLLSILCCYYEACFSRFDEGALERAELAQLISRNRGLAWVMLALGLLLFLPMLLVVLLAVGCRLAGEAQLPGLGLELGACFLIFGAIGPLLGQLFLLILLNVLCTLRLEWEPRGVALALADMLHTSPRVLQHIWRALACLPIVSLILMYI